MAPPISPPCKGGAGVVLKNSRMVAPRGQSRILIVSYSYPGRMLSYAICIPTWPRKNPPWHEAAARNVHGPGARGVPATPSNLSHITQPCCSVPRFCRTPGRIAIHRFWQDARSFSTLYRVPSFRRILAELTVKAFRQDWTDISTFAPTDFSGREEDDSEKLLKCLGLGLAAPKLPSV